MKTLKTLRTRNFYVGVTIAALVAALAIAQYALQTVASAQEGNGNRAGIYQVDPLWPKPLPNSWVLGATVGLAVDSRDHVFIVHRGQSSLDQKFASQMSFTPPAPRGGGARGAAPARGGFAAPSAGNTVAGYGPTDMTKPISELCCSAAPPVLEFDPEGNLVNHWGAPGAGFEWPPSMHGITVDGKGNVWLAGNGGDTVLKFSRDGKFLLQIGKNGQSKGNTDTANLSRPAEVEVVLADNEIYVADGYGNRRVIVYDADTGAFKRMWGAYGKPPVDPQPGTQNTYDPAAPLPQYFRTVHCATPANDGLIYVCDRAHDRIQVFRKDGTFVKEAQIAKRTLGDGTTFDIAFSKDPQQRLMYVADGANHRVWQLLREPLLALDHIGNGGRYPGQFYATHNVSLDSKGNLYTVETYTGARVQKFTYKGQRTIAKPEGNHN